MSDTETTNTPEVSNTQKRLFERGDVELLTIKLSDAVLNPGHVPDKLYEYAFKKYLKDNGLEKEVNTPQDLATYNLLNKLDEEPADPRG